MPKKKLPYLNGFFLSIGLLFSIDLSKQSSKPVRSEASSELTDDYLPDKLRVSFISQVDFLYGN